MICSFKIMSGEIIEISELNLQFCREKHKDILQLINIIPHISWNEADLFFENDFFGNKWGYSLVATNANKEIIGVLIAYFRISDDKHIMDSLYIHKLAVRPDYQSLGLGTEILKLFISKSFEEILWLCNITVQTNKNETNKHVIKFYNKLGFNELYLIKYPNKTDILMLYERWQYNKNKFKTQKYDYSVKKLCHPRLNSLMEMDTKATNLPMLYFSSTNIYKKELVKFIFNNYNIEVEFVSSSVPLVEPQVEKPIFEEEQSLVEFPLKFVSRFLNRLNGVPYVIEDSMLFIEFFNRNSGNWELPGHDTKRWWRQLGAEGILSIMGDTNSRKARFVSQTGAYIKSNEYYFGRGETTGHISEKALSSLDLAKGTYPKFFHLIFIPDGSDKTLAEMDVYEFSKYDYIRKSIKELINQLDYSYLFHDSYTLFEL